MKDFNLSRVHFHEMLKKYCAPNVEFLYSKLNFCTTKGLVNLDPEKFEFGSFKFKTLRWKEWLALALASYHVEDESLRIELLVQLQEVQLGEYEFLKFTIQNKYVLLNYLWNSSFSTTFVLHLCGQIFSNAKRKISIRNPRYKILTKPNPVRRIGIGYKDQGSARNPSKQIIQPSDARKLQYLLHVERLKKKQNLLDLQSFLLGLVD